MKIIFFWAILIRLFLMPFFFHPDIKTQYYHANFLSEGITNIYQYVEENQGVLAYKDHYNYPPLAYFTLGTYAAIIKPILGADYQHWLQTWTGDWFTDDHLFRYLFVLKLPYLFLDLGIAWLIYKISAEKFRKTALILWLFNPLSLYIIYAVSNFDIIPTFLALLALYILSNLKHKRRYFITAIILGLAAGLKLFPLLLVPLFAGFVYKEKGLKQAIQFGLESVAIFILSTSFFLADFTQAGNNNLTLSILHSTTPIIPIPTFFLVLAGLGFLILGYPLTIQRLISYIVILFLSLYTITDFHPQWFLWVLPFLTILIAQRLILLVLMVPMFFSYIALILTMNDEFLTVGLLSPLITTVYASTSLEEQLFQYVDKDQLHEAAKFIFSLTTFSIIVLILKEKWLMLSKKLEEFLRNWLLTILNTVSVLAFLIMIFIVVIFATKMIPVASQKEVLRELDVYKDHSLSTEFTTSEDRIDKFYVRLSNVNLDNHSPFTFTLFGEDGKELRKLNLSGDNIGFYDYVKIQIEPLTGVKDKKLSFLLESENTVIKKAIKVSADKNQRAEFEAFREGTIQEVVSMFWNDFYRRITFDKVFLFGYLLGISIILISWRRLHL